ncbi:hypothetical protein HMPREF1344_02561 [Enterococcus faecalis R508]|nr:hypothetical protein HMPREF1344_02561 [Enterococcus faecalis R508]EPH63838.1 hypothetical protein D930_02258 [Enterococcus faecalis KI-6-1-110608-1]
MAVASDTNNYARKMTIFKNLVGMAFLKIIGSIKASSYIQPTSLLFY